MKPSISIKGLFHSAQERTFKNQDNEEITFYQISILTDDTYRPIMSFTIDQDILIQNDLLDSKTQEKLKGQEIILDGSISYNSREVNGSRIQILKVKIDDSIQFLA